MITARDWAIAAARAAAVEAVEVPTGVTLAAFQEHAATRLVAMIQRWGGALLADAVGLGKTRVALVVASALARDQRIHGDHGPVAFVVPARLTAEWRSVATAAGIDNFIVVSHTALSRGNVPAIQPAVVIVDEAHRFRNATARRERLLRWTTAPTLLATATPVANSLDDLWNLLELFLDDAGVREAFGWDLKTSRRLAAAGEWDPLELIREVTVRRTVPPEEAGFGRRPSTALRVAEYEPTEEEAWLWANLEQQVREISLFREHEDWPQALFVEHVLRRWESGPDALRDTIRELTAYAQRSLEAARAGRPLDRSSFRTLFGAQPAQEVFGFLLDQTSGRVANIDAVELDVRILSRLQAAIDNICKQGGGREQVVLGLAGDGEPLLVFTSYRSAAEGLFKRLRRTLGPSARIGLMTGGTATATGLGRVPPHEILQRFSPNSHGMELRPHERLQVLVATDCISEGVNLQDCGRVVLADLPYSPLGVEQRVGRLVRPGGPHATVEVILPRPRNWNDSLGMRRRLDVKVDAARSGGFADVTGPLEAWTVLEKIARLEHPLVSAPPACKLTDNPTSWLVVARVCGRIWTTVVGEPLGFTRTLNDLVWDKREATACTAPAAVYQVLEARLRFLRAARAAPAPIQLHSPEAAAWAMLVDNERELAIAKQLDALRTRLLVSHRGGTRRQLESVLALNSPARTLRFVRSLPQPAPEPTVDLILALGL